MRSEILTKEKEAAADGIREEIVAGAANAFQRYGYSKVTMNDISKASGKVRSTVYKYFSNKNEVLDAVTERILSSIMDNCFSAASKRRSFSANIENYFSSKLDKLKQLVDQYQLLVSDLKSDPGIIMTRSRIMQDKELHIIGTIIGWAIENDEIKPLEDEDRSFLAETLHIAFKSFEIDILLFGRFPQYAEKLSWLAQILHKGLS